MEPPTAEVWGRSQTTHGALGAIVLVADKSYEFLAKTPPSSLRSPSCFAATRLRATGQLPNHTSASGSRVARRSAQGTAARRPRTVLKPQPGEVMKREPTIKRDIRCGTSNNLLGTPVYTQARSFLQRP